MLRLPTAVRHHPLSETSAVDSRTYHLLYNDCVNGGGEALSLEIDRPRRDGDRSSIFSAKTKNEWSYTSSPHIRMSTWQGTS
jgi:hypothetical protein